MEKLKAAMAKSLTGEQVTDAEAADAIGEVVDVVASIAHSLERLATCAEQNNGIWNKPVA